MKPSPLATLALLAAVAAPTAAAAAKTQGIVSFRTPSGKIGCIYSSAFQSEPAELRCDIRSRLRNPQPQRPAGCDLDWGDSLAMGRTGGVTLVCHGDTAIDLHARVLAYGRVWRRDGFSCSSQRIGLRCRNLSGHGFFLSRQRWQRF